MQGPIANATTLDALPRVPDGRGPTCHDKHAVGFIDAGVILHQRHNAEQGVAGLTTAASIWVAAALGAACGSGHWVSSAFAWGLTLAVLAFAGSIERAIERRYDAKGGGNGDPSR